MAEVRALQLQLQELHRSLVQAHKLRNQQVALCGALQGEQALAGMRIGLSLVVKVSSVRCTLPMRCVPEELRRGVVDLNVARAVLPDKPTRVATDGLHGCISLP